MTPEERLQAFFGDAIFLYEGFFCWWHNPETFDLKACERLLKRTTFLLERSSMFAPETVTKLQGHLSTFTALLARLTEVQKAEEALEDKENAALFQRLRSVLQFGDFVTLHMGYGANPLPPVLRGNEPVAGGYNTRRRRFQIVEIREDKRMFVLGLGFQKMGRGSKQQGKFFKGFIEVVPRNSSEALGILHKIVNDQEVDLSLVYQS